jgi:hypothetical protein
MTTGGYARLAALLFAIIAVLQFIRAVGGWQILVNETVSVPVWASWIACVVTAGLAWMGFRVSRPRPRGNEEQKEFRKWRRKESRKRERAEHRPGVSGSATSLSKEERKRLRKQERDERRKDQTKGSGQN